MTTSPGSWATEVEAVCKVTVIILDPPDVSVIVTTLICSVCSVTVTTSVASDTKFSRLRYPSIHPWLPITGTALPSRHLCLLIHQTELPS